jgi:transcriptional regulator with GAF, ATPase, and Fis domain
MTEESNLGSSDSIEQIRFADTVGIAGWVLREGAPVLLNDVRKDARFYDGVDLQSNFTTRALICTPLVTRSGIIGVLYALNKKSGAFTGEEARIMEVISGPIAVAIENAKLYGELKQRTDDLAEENRRLRSSAQERFNLQGIIGSSPAMVQVFSLMEKVMDTTTAVLIMGETGTGKELAAKVIHYNGPLKEKPFVVENCGALSETLLESELFGHVKGAFTGAIRDKMGLFEKAHGGTVFLDEIGEMPLAMQVKLLRVLQEGQLRPVGGDHLKRVKFRLISSTNRNLEAAVQKGIMREDFFYRINVFPIVMPPLRDRGNDITQLAQHFLDNFSKKLRRPKARFTSAALALLSTYHWPGNIRQLENEVERALTLAGKQGLINEKCLSPNIRTPSQQTINIGAADQALRDVVKQVEIQMISEALREKGGNRTQTARKLGLTRQGLINKINRYGIEY